MLQMKTGQLVRKRRTSATRTKNRKREKGVQQGSKGVANAARVNAEIGINAKESKKTRAGKRGVTTLVSTRTPGYPHSILSITFAA
tara:strand:+ start:806 stop:1063 length:258 start_codon:yes stop_codon:yes gene_type:complete